MMHRIGLTVLLLAAALAPSAMAAEPRPPLTLEAAIPLPAVTGRIDHMAVDLARKRLIIAELGNGSVEVIDLAARRVLHRIAGLKEPQGVGYVPGSDLIVVASAGDGSVRFFNAATFAPAGTVDLGEDADNIRVDPAGRQVFVGYGDGAIAILDPGARTRVGDIPLPAHPEGFQLDPASPRLFINLPDARRIAVADRTSRTVVDVWKQADLRSNFPLMLDGAAGSLATVFRSPPTLVLFDGRTGAVRARSETCADSDDVFLDDKRHRIYVSCGQGVVDVFAAEPPLPRLARIPTAPGARTSLFVPELDRLFVAARAGFLGDQAKLLVFKPDYRH